MKKQLIKTGFLLVLLLTLSVKVLPQDVEMISPYFSFQYIKNTDNQRLLKGTLTFTKEGIELPLQGFEVDFYTGQGNMEKLGSITTDEKGIALFTIGEDTKLPTDSEGLWSFSSEFPGNDTIEAVSKELTIKNIDMVMELSEIDSIKNVTVNVTTLENGKRVPLAGEMLYIYVPRMFSMLPVAEVYLDDNGSGTVEFPSDIPGDKEGNLTVIARFDQHASFGNVEKKEITQWGVPTSLEIPKTHRALWTKTPPWWMIITLSVLLAGVWGHYLFAVISLIRIKIDAKREQDKAEYRL